MRIFTAVKHSRDLRYYYGSLWSDNFYPALRQLGCEILESQVDLLPASRFMHVADRFTRQEREVRDRITQQILEEVCEAHKKRPVHLFLSYFYNAHFNPAAFAELHRLGIPTVNFYCNSVNQFEFVEQIAAKVAFSWHTEKHARPNYLKAGATPVWVPLGADPELYHSVEAPRQAKACFIGQRYADRDRWVSALVKANIPIDIYGAGWRNPEACQTPLEKTGKSGRPRHYLGRNQLEPGSARSYLHAAVENLRVEGLWGGLVRTWRQQKYRLETRRLFPLWEDVAKGPIPFQDKLCSVFSHYEVVVNFSNVWEDGRPGSALIPHVRLRDFEAPLCRTCYVTGYTEEIAELYELGKEIEAYRSQEELLDKVRFYLSHPSEAERLREAGYQRALRDHTWTQRFQQLFRETGQTSSWQKVRVSRELNW